MSRKVWIDAGHGGGDCGAVGCVKGQYEDDVVLDIAKRAKKLCLAQGLEVGMTRETDVFVGLNERARRANAWGADLFFSIHCNSFNTSAHGMEIFAFDSASAKKAEKIYSPILATAPHSTNRGIKTANYAVLRETSMMAVLLETAFIDNTNDIKYLMNDKDRFALAICKGILAHFGMSYKEPETNKPSTGGQVFYRVVVSSNTDIDNARADRKVAISRGFEDTFIGEKWVKGVKYYQVILTSVTHYASAEETLRDAKAKNFNDAFIDKFVK